MVLFSDFSPTYKPQAIHTIYRQFLIVHIKLLSKETGTNTAVHTNILPQLALDDKIFLNQLQRLVFNPNQS